MGSTLRTGRAPEVLAVILMGDGPISVLRPVRHSPLWWMPLPGVRPLMDLMEWCAERPNVTRASGPWLDARLYASPPTVDERAPARFR